MIGITAKPEKNDSLKALNTLLLVNYLMRYFIPLLSVCSGLAVATAYVNESAQVAFATQIKPDTQIAAVSAATPAIAAPKTHVTCSRNRPLQVSADGTTIASADLPQSLRFASSIVQLFCRDVRINTIVVRDYCAVVRE